MAFTLVDGEWCVYTHTRIGAAAKKNGNVLNTFPWCDGPENSGSGCIGVFSSFSSYVQARTASALLKVVLGRMTASSLAVSGR